MQLFGTFQQFKGYLHEKASKNFLRKENVKEKKAKEINDFVFEKRNLQELIPINYQNHLIQIYFSVRSQQNWIISSENLNINFIRN